jgi:hypothetical protein
MKTNKLTIEEQYLTLSQSKELQALGIDFNSANFAFNKVTNDLILLGNGIAENWGYGSKDRMYARTLSVAEMIEMLPKCIEVKDVLCELYLKKSSFYVGDMTYELGYRGYLNESLSIKEFTYPLLRDSLFEMIKWLKQNKLI